MYYRSIRNFSKIFQRDFFISNKKYHQCRNVFTFCCATENKKVNISNILSNVTFVHFSDCPPKCWQCDFPQKSEIFCSKCKVLQKLPEEMNYFDIIGVKKEYNVDIYKIQKKYRELQSLLHPDKFGNKSETERQLSESISSLINKAYSTLLHPLDRGIYMLKLQNITIPEGTTNLDPEFLMEIMEKNEDVEDAADNKEKTLALLKENREILTKLTKEVSDAFDKEDLEKAKHLLTRMKYYISINKRLKASKQNLGIVE